MAYNKYNEGTGCVGCTDGFGFEQPTEPVMSDMQKYLVGPCTVDAGALPLQKDRVALPGREPQSTLDRTMRQKRLIRKGALKAVAQRRAPVMQPTEPARRPEAEFYAKALDPRPDIAPGPPLPKKVDPVRIPSKVPAMVKMERMHREMEQMPVPPSGLTPATPPKKGGGLRMTADAFKKMLIADVTKRKISGPMVGLYQWGDLSHHDHGVIGIADEAAIWHPPGVVREVPHKMVPKIRAAIGKGSVEGLPLQTLWKPGGALDRPQPQPRPMPMPQPQPMPKLLLPPPKKKGGGLRMTADAFKKMLIADVTKRKISGPMVGLYQWGDLSHHDHGILAIADEALVWSPPGVVRKLSHTDVPKVKKALKARSIEGLPLQTLWKPGGAANVVDAGIRLTRPSAILASGRIPGFRQPPPMIRTLPMPRTRDTVLLPSVPPRRTRRPGFRLPGADLRTYGYKSGLLDHFKGAIRRVVDAVAQPTAPVPPLRPTAPDYFTGRLVPVPTIRRHPGGKIPPVRLPEARITSIGPPIPSGALPAARITGRPAPNPAVKQPVTPIGRSVASKMAAEMSGFGASQLDPSKICPKGTMPNPRYTPGTRQSKCLPSIPASWSGQPIDGSSKPPVKPPVKPKAPSGTIAGVPKIYIYTGAALLAAKFLL